MKKLMIMCITILVFLSACTNEIPEPEQCSLCAGLPRHAPCIINLNTGELLELAVYEPHPFIAGELADEQQSGTFSFIRGAGVKGYKLKAKSITITIPMRGDKMEEKHFCYSCREQLVDYAGQGYVIVDLQKSECPIIYKIATDTMISFRCYNITVCESKVDSEYEATILGTMNIADSSYTN